jgi:hypothetical protein
MASSMPLNQKPMSPEKIVKKDAGVSWEDDDISFKEPEPNLFKDDEVH